MKKGNGNNKIFTLVNNVNFLKNIFNEVEYVRYDFFDYEKIYKNAIRDIIKARIELGVFMYLNTYIQDNGQLIIIIRYDEGNKALIYDTIDIGLYLYL